MTTVGFRVGSRRKGDCMAKNIGAIDALTAIALQAVKEVLEANTKIPIKASSTVQKVPKVSMKPEIGCFVPFTGDYNGLVVMNFSAGAAMLLYRSYMMAMGLPEDDLAKEYTNVEVPDSIGEMVNQIMGKLTKLTQDTFGLSSYCSQPKALALNSAIILTIDTDYRENRRLSFSINNERFYFEIAMETAEFIQNGGERPEST
jgi:CheY-specific phosphatase CheX